MQIDTDHIAFDFSLLVYININYLEPDLTCSQQVLIVLIGEVEPDDMLWLCILNAHLQPAGLTIVNLEDHYMEAVGLAQGMQDGMVTISTKS